MLVWPLQGRLQVSHHKWKLRKRWNKLPAARNAQARNIPGTKHKHPCSKYRKNGLNKQCLTFLCMSGDAVRRRKRKKIKQNTRVNWLHLTTISIFTVRLLPTWLCPLASCSSPDKRSWESSRKGGPASQVGSREIQPSDPFTWWSPHPAGSVPSYLLWDTHGFVSQQSEKQINYKDAIKDYKCTWRNSTEKEPLSPSRYNTLVLFT